MSGVDYARPKLAPAKETVAAKIRRLAAAAAVSNPLINPVATGVTMSTTTATDNTLTNGANVIVTPQLFSTYGGTELLYADTFGVYPVANHSPGQDGNLASYVSVTPGLSASMSALGWEKGFYTDAPRLQIVAFGYAYATLTFRIIIDGQYVSFAGTEFGNGYNTITLDFSGVRKPRHIQFCGMVTCGFIGVNIDPLSTIWPPDQSDTLRVCFTGDSYTENEGVASDSELPDGMWCHVVGRYLGWRDIRQVACGGTGYLNTANSTRKAIFGQIDDWIGLDPDIVVFAGGYNDQPGPLMTAAALACFRKVREADATCPIFVLGPWSGSGGQNATTLAKEDCISAAVTDFGDALTTFIPQQRIVSPWISGTGFLGATNGTGNSDVAIGPDGIHPSDYGNLLIGRRAAEAIRGSLALLGT